MSEGSGVHTGLSPLGTPNIAFWKIHDYINGIEKYKLFITELSLTEQWGSEND